jgi:ABC-type uncharacterized transport system permease subunit
MKGQAAIIIRAKEIFSSAFFTSILFVICGLIFSVSTAWLLGESPVKVLSVLIAGSLGTPTNIGYSLFYATPLVFTGLSCCWAFRCGLFNIGAEGQATLAGVAMIGLALALPADLGFIGIFAVLVFGFIVGGVWGSLAGWLKSYRGTHEVLSTILLNFISYGLSSFVIVYLLLDVQSQAPETTSIAESFRLSKLFSELQRSPLNYSFLISLVAVVLVEFLMFKTVFGFRQRLSGENPRLASMSGRNPKLQIVISMFVSGGIAGLAGISELFGFAYKAKEGFMAGSGFVGIAVALIARNRPIAIVFSAILFGALHKGSLDLDMDTENLSRDFSVVIQSLVILFVVSEKGLKDLWNKIFLSK